MIHRFAVCVTFAALLAACGEAAEVSVEAEAPGAPDTADEMRAMIDTQGAEATWAALTGPQGDETGPLFAGIGSGQADWLALAPDLEPAADGWFAEGLQEALYVALPNNAPGVLALIPEHADLAFVCRPAGDPPTPDQTTANEAGIAAVEAVTDPALAEARAACLEGLRS